MSASPAWRKTSSGLYVRSDGPRVCRFGEEYIVQTKGRWAGQKIVHEPWQRQFLNELFLRKWPSGDLVYDRALLGIGRKNGQSTLSAELALYGLIGMGEASPEVYAGAAAKDQAGIVFNQSKQFVESSPLLMDWLKPQRNVILCPNNKGIFKVLSADGGLQMGLNPNMVVIDELHEHKNRSLWDAMTTADLARENPLVIAITTAGFDRDSVCFEQYEYGLDLLQNGGIEAMRREGFLFWWYGVPFEENGQPVDYRDQSYWGMANPSSWITNERLERYQRRMPENVFRRLHLNQWTESEEAWIKAWEWDACRGKPIWDNRAPTWMAIDIGGRRDASAIVWAQWHGDKLHIGQELLIPTDERKYSLEESQNTLAKWARVHTQLKEVAYDPWQFQVAAEQMENRGMPMVEFPQMDSRMGPASETLSQLIGEKRIVHDGNPDLRKHVLAAVAVPTERGGWKVSKKKSLERIDGCVALVMCADRAVTMKSQRPKGTVHIY